MARFYQVQLGLIYITSTGLVGGTGCELEVTNVEDLIAPVTGVSIPVIGGGNVRQIVPWTKGKSFEIKVNVMFSTLYSDLETFLNNSNETDTSFTLIITGDIYDLELTVKPRLQKPIARGAFQNGISNNVVMAFETV
jgi:hypothetical protein